MKAKKPLAVLTLFSLFTAASIYGVSARWTLPIHPGDHVIDITRLAKSISETVQMAAVYSAKVQQLKNQFTYAAGIDASRAVNTLTGDAIALDGAMNPDGIDTNKLASFGATQPYGREALKDNGELSKSLWDESVLADKNFIATAGTVMNRLSNDTKVSQQIMLTKTDGVQGENQKTAAMESIQGLSLGDRGRIIGTTLVNDIVQDELNHQQEVFDNQAVRARWSVQFEDPYTESTYKADTKKDLPTPEEAAGFPDF